MGGGGPSLSINTVVGLWDDDDHTHYGEMARWKCSHGGYSRFGETRSQSASNIATECRRVTSCSALQCRGTQRREELFCMTGQASSGRMRAMALREASIARKYVISTSNVIPGGTARIRYTVVYSQHYEDSLYSRSFTYKARTWRDSSFASLCIIIVCLVSNCSVIVESTLPLCTFDSFKSSIFARSSLSTSTSGSQVPPRTQSSHYVLVHVVQDDEGEETGEGAG